MDLREKALLGFVGVLIITMVVLASLSFLFIERNYLNLESSHVQSDVNLVSKDIDSEIAGLSSNAPDWGGWNETYTFVLGQNPDYARTNLVNATFRSLGVNFIIITDVSGKILYGEGYNLSADAPEPLRSDIRDEIEQGRILNATLNGQAVSGFLLLPGGPVIISTYQVLHSDYTGPPVGIVIIGKYINTQEIANLTEGTATAVSVSPVDPSTISPSDAALLSGSGESSIIVRPLSQDTVEGTKLLRDVYGNASVYLTVDASRDIFQQGRETIFFFIMLQLIIVMSLGLLCITLLDRMVLARISAMNEDIAGIMQGTFGSARIRKTYPDELGRLASAMNLLLDQVGKDQAEIRENEVKFREIFNSVNDGIELHEAGTGGRGGRFLEVNDVTCTMLGYSRAELLTLGPDDVNSGNYNRPVPDIGREIQASGRARFEVERRRKDGTIVPVEINTHVITLRGERLVLSAVRDITERRKSDEALRLVIRKLGILSSITRHDILNQLSVLIGYLEISKELAGEQRLREYIEKEEKAANAIEAQIRFTKDYEDIGIHAPQWQDLEKTIFTAIRPLSPLPVRLSVEVANVEIFADPLLGKVFYNLVENAIRHGGDVTVINVSSSETPEGLLVVCENDGTGIPREEKENIFNRKYFRHTGLGLFLAREILGMTGIGIRENGDPDNGARFEILVPGQGYRILKKG